MTKKILFCLGMLALAACDRGSVTDSGNETVAIIGGGPVTPGMPLAKSVVAIHGSDGLHGFLCTGVLITQNKILTAGHCGTGLKMGQIVFSTNISTNDPKIVREITGVNVQPRFGATAAKIDAHQVRSSTSVKNWGDLAVLTFSGAVPAGYRPVSIAGQDAVVDGETVLLAGYGVTDGTAGTESNVLQAVAVQVKSARYSKTEFTVDQSESKGACHGDSGGPAFVANGKELLLVGITSRGVDDACAKATIYTRVSEFLDWIQEAIR